jgi:hypothetical protein
VARPSRTTPCDPHSQNQVRRAASHLIFRHAAGLRCSISRLARGIDVKADGGCCTWWPAAGFAVLCNAELAPWPLWLLAQLRPASQPQPTDARQVVPDDRRLQQLLRCVSTAPEGQRNAITFWAACRFGEMVTTGLLSESDAIVLIVGAATCTGLPRAEAIATARSGLRTAGRS